MATGSIALDTGSTLRTATHTISEDAVTKHIPRSVLSIADGTDHGIATNPIYVIPSGGVSAISGVVAVTGNIVVLNTVTITGSTAVISLPAITGSVTVANAALTVTGSVAVISLPAITGSVTVTGSVAVINEVTVTGSTAVISLPAVTGSVSVINTVAVTGSVAVVAMPTTTVTGSVVVISTPAITGSVSVISTPAVTGSVTLVGTSTITGSTTLAHIAFPNSGTSVLTVTGATTNGIVIPSHATLSIYLTDLIVSTLTAGHVTLGETNTTTASNVKIGTLYLAANGGMSKSYTNPTKLSATTNLVMTSVSNSNLTITAGYYYAA